jgi:hypothetical protein
MSYTVRVTRRSPDLEPVADDLTIEEWCSFVDEDASVCFLGDALEQTLPDGRIMRMRTPNGFWALTGPKGDLTLTFSDASISAGIRDLEVIPALVALAGRLRAHVIGEEGETYES